MYKVSLEINSSIYDHIMFFLENLPKNLVKIKQEVQSKKQFGKEIFNLKNISNHQKNSITKMKSLQGLGKELYHDIDSDTYIKELRNEW
jgi:predicted transcriptional regulator